MSTIVVEREQKRRPNREVLQYAKRFQEKYMLHQFWIDKSMGKKIGEISAVPDVNIAEAGCFKYILIEVQDRGTTYGQTKLVVRGDASCAYHGKKDMGLEFYRGVVCLALADVLDIMQDQIDESKLTLDCKGGGRMRVNPQTRTISVYGYSMVSDWCEEGFFFEESICLGIWPC